MDNVSQVGGRNYWVHGRLVTEGWFPESHDEAEKWLEEELYPASEDLFERYEELLFIADMTADEPEKAEFIAETSFLIKEGVKQIGNVERDLWGEEVNNYIAEYFDNGEIFELELPPEETEEFYVETIDMLNRMKDSTGIQDNFRERVDRYIERYFE
ncbi:MAG: hypothetical protein ABEJ56_04285 [Candidatus Nanohaloarchaea archaeon]